MGAILAPVKLSTSLRKLEIHGFYSTEVCLTVADVLRQNESLKHVSLDSRDMYGDQLELKAVVAMVCVLKQTRNWTS